MRRTRVLIAALAVCLLASAGLTYYRTVAVGTAMSEGAQAFLASLSAEQRATAQMPYAAPQRFDWHFIPKETRKGLQLRDMSEPQREAAHELLRSALSQVGYDKAQQIMSLESLLHEFEGSGRRFARDPERYYFTVFGDPASAARWGLSVEGHHLSLNFVVEGDEVVSSTPQVFCTNPAEVKNENETGIEVGTRVLREEETLAFDLVNSLTDEQKQAVIFDATAPREVREPGSAQPPQDPPIGLPAAKLNAGQQKTLRSLLEAYASKMPDEVADARMSAINESKFENVHFAWAGPTEPGIGHYYRIQGPTFVAEFVNTQPDAAGNPANHIHAVWRDMRGDFGVPVE